MIYDTKRILLTLRFDGSGFYGWQAQNGGNTVQQTVQDAIETVFRERLGVSGCGRTDSGVHALGYCCHIDIKKDFPTERLANALNLYFFSQNIKIAVVDACEVSDDFHSRYYIKSKEYIYKIQNNKYRDPFYTGKALHYHRPIDIDKMREAAEYLKGEHNFACFMADRSDIPVEQAVRNLYRLEIEIADEKCRIINIIMAASGFLYKMARIISGTLLEVSEGKINPVDLSGIINSRNRRNAGRTLPPHGLYLNKIEYYSDDEIAELIKSGDIYK